MVSWAHRSLNPARKATEAKNRFAFHWSAGTSIGTRPPVTNTKSARPKIAPISGRMAPAKRGDTVALGAVDVESRAG